MMALMTNLRAVFSFSAAEQELRAGQQDSSVVFARFSIWYLVTTGYALYGRFEAANDRKAILLYVASILAISAGGLVGCYVANGKQDGTRLLERFIVLALPNSIQMAVGLELFYLLASWAYPYLPGSFSDEMYYQIWITGAATIGIAVTIAWFLRMAAALRRVRN